MHRSATQELIPSPQTMLSDYHAARQVGKGLITTPLSSQSSTSTSQSMPESLLKAPSSYQSLGNINLRDRRIPIKLLSISPQPSLKYRKPQNSSIEAGGFPDSSNELVKQHFSLPSPPFFSTLPRFVTRERA